MSIRIDGKMVSDLTRERIKAEAARLQQAHGIPPCLAVIMVGDNPASAVYVRNKHKACLSCDIRSLAFTYESDITEDELLRKIDELNADPEVHGILVQLPLPKHIDEGRVQRRIAPEKDVDAFHPENVGLLMTDDIRFAPCTPMGVITLLKHYKIEMEGKNCVIVGRSNIVGKPMAHLMLRENATVTVCHSRTKNLSELTRSADILIVAIGRARFITADMVKPGAVVIDVGINRLADGSLCGDADTEALESIASYITPVPGGVGPMTITTLLENTIRAAADLSAKKM